MQAMVATWDFTRSHPESGPGQPLGVDALHALQGWRIGHEGRDFRLARVNPFHWTGQLHARLTHLPQDERADSDLCLSCEQHHVHASARECRGRQPDTAAMPAQPAQALAKLGQLDADLAALYERTRGDRRKRQR